MTDQSFGPQEPMRPYAIYEIATGRIVYSCTGPRSKLPVEEGQAVIAADVRPATHYVRDGIAMLRTRLEVVVEGRTVKGLPAGTSILPVGHPTITASGDWTAPSDLGPSIQVLLDHPHHLRQTIELRDYRADRAEAYPGMGDQLDAIWRGLRAVSEAGVELPAETKAALDHIAAVKHSIPKD